MKRKQILIMFVVLFLVSAGILLPGEAGEVSGTVSFEGLLMPGVTVEVDSPKLAEKRTTLSSEEGIYSFAKLPAGKYSFFFKLEGFKTIMFKGITVKPGKKLEINARMKPAALREEIVVFGIKKASVEKEVKKSPAAGKPGHGHLDLPRLLKKAKPEYPPEALAKGFHGDVVIDAVIDVTGSLTNMKVKKGKYACLITSAAAALKQWKYKPVMLNGIPRESDVSVKIAFELKTEK